MTRNAFIEGLRRSLAGDFPNDEFPISIGMVNNLINPAIAAAAKANWNENIKIDNIGFVSSSFYTTFSGISLTKDGEFGVYNAALPHIPVGLGRNEGIAATYLVSPKGEVSKPLIMLNLNQVNYADSLPAPNGIMCWNEGVNVKIKSPNTPLIDYKLKIRLISGGLDSNLDSQLSIPSEYISFMRDFIKTQLLNPTAPLQDLTNDGTPVR